MAQDYAKAFYASDAWHRCRLGYIRHRRSIDGGLCEECHEQPGYIVHHKKHITQRTLNDPDITLAFDNLEYVCKACHDKLHNYCGRECSRDQRIVFDAKGNPIPVRG